MVQPPTTERPSRPAAASARLFGVGEDPLAWSIPLASIGGVPVRAHAVLAVWIGAELLAWLPKHAVGFAHVATGVAAFVIVVLVRELARAAVARSLGAEADGVVLWPLGGLTSMFIPREAPGASRPMLAEIGGLAAGMVLLPILACGVLASGAGWDALSLDLFSPRVAAGGLRSWWQIGAWWLYYANAAVLAANLLLPMAPFDLWRLLRARLARRGDAGIDLATRVGLLAALALFIGSASAGETRLMAVAALAAMATYMDFRRLEFRLDAGGDHAPPPPVPAEEAAPAVPEPTLDGVLAKISVLGLDALDVREREVLARETERRRRGDGPREG